MKIKFPFQITQCAADVVEVELVSDGKPLLEILTHECFKGITDQDYERIYDVALRALIVASIQVTN